MIMLNSYVNNCSANTKQMKSRVRQSGAFSMASYNQGELSKGNKHKWTITDHVGGECEYLSGENARKVLLGLLVQILFLCFY